jgi:hypothetical protein
MFGRSLFGRLGGAGREPRLAAFRGAFFPKSLSTLEAIIYPPQRLAPCADLCEQVC